MDEPIRFEPTQQEAASLTEAFDRAIAEMKAGRERMRKDQEEIDGLKTDIRLLRDETRQILAHLKHLA